MRSSGWPSTPVLQSQLKTKFVISDELSGEFFVPSYQLGYRWGETEVVNLLKDINAEVIAAPVPSSYYLQPIVVAWRKEEGNWELIDGQRRLTTLLLIVKYLRDSNWLPRAKVNYSLTYETRENSRRYLETLDSSLRGTHIDFHYIYSAYEAIEKWFEGEKASDNVPAEVLPNLFRVDGDAEPGLLLFESQEWNLFEACLKHYGSKQFSLAETVVPFAVIIFRQMRPKGSDKDLQQRLRSLRNIAESARLVRGGRSSPDPPGLGTALGHVRQSSCPGDDGVEDDGGTVLDW
jgi:Protein of unknown function DUF262